MRFAGSLLALLLGTSIVACKSTEDSEKRQEAAAKMRQEEARANSDLAVGGDGTQATVGGSSYRPKCSTSGIKEREFELDFKENKDDDGGYMRLVSGDGFDCKKDESTDGDNKYPLCDVECPGAKIDGNGWGFCTNGDGGDDARTTKGIAKKDGFDCK